MTNHHNAEHNSEHQVEHHEVKVDEQSNEIAELKAEILGSLKEKENKSALPWGSLLVTIILAVLTLLSVAQTAQSVVLLSKIKNGNVNLGGSAPAASVQDVPDMVGGC